MSRSLTWPLVTLLVGVVGYVGSPVLAALLGVATWDGTYDDRGPAVALFWLQMLSFAAAVLGLLVALVVAANRWRGRDAQPRPHEM